MTYQDWLPPEHMTPEEWAKETPLQRKRRQELEKWKAERIADHRRLIALVRGTLDPSEPYPAKPNVRPRPGSAWS